MTEEADDTTPSPVDSIAAAFAIGSASRERADAFLKKQELLVELQIEDMRREDSVRHWSLRVRHISDVMKLSFELALGFILLVVVAAIIGALWSSEEATGVVISPFSVPPDLAARGLTGEVVATKMLDRLSDMQVRTNSVRAASSYANNWGSDIKVQIPDTGVSVGELIQYLHGWLGHETQISGSVYRTPSGIAVTARAGGVSSPVFTGADADLDALIQKAAEAVYRSTQPYRYAVYLDQSGHNAEAYAAYQALIATGTRIDRAYAYSAVANDLPLDTGNFEKARQMSVAALAIAPKLLLARENLEQNDALQHHDEQTFEDIREDRALEAQGRDPTMDEVDFAKDVLQDDSKFAFSLGDFQAALKADSEIAASQDKGNSVEEAHRSMVTDCGMLHDAECFRNVVAELPAVADDSIAQFAREGATQTADSGLERWTDIVAIEPGMRARFDKLGVRGNIFLVRNELPLTALAHAELGDFRTAHAEIDRTPLDCVSCLRSRGTIDALAGDWRGAQYWFARAVSGSKSLPFAYLDWGASLLREGRYDGAIAQFTLANQKGPHFADPLELWGEALTAKNRSDLALPKFAEACEYAPHWGRLHLKWGEALLWSADNAGAQKQFDIASTLDLSSTERLELARVRTLHG
jgi:tetratricopeptide (TPR) repeat protein